MVIRHEPTGVEGQAAERRSQQDNHRNAVKRLRIHLAVAVRSVPAEGATPSELWRSRCREGKIVCSEAHDDFAAMLSEALDVIADHRGHLHASAEFLACTVSQLSKFLAKEPAAFQQMNELRRQAGLPPRSV